MICAWFHTYEAKRRGEILLGKGFHAVNGSNNRKIAIISGGSNAEISFNVVLATI